MTIVHWFYCVIVSDTVYRLGHVDFRNVSQTNTCICVRQKNPFKWSRVQEEEDFYMYRVLIGE